MARPRGIQYQEIQDENVGAGLNVPGFDITMSTEAANMTGSIGATAKYAILWQPVGRPKDKTYRHSLINQAAVTKKCDLRDEKTGKPLWYREIPAGGRPETHEPKYRCPVCTKTFRVEAIEGSSGVAKPGALQMAEHVYRVHGKDTYDRWKPQINRLLASVVNDPTALFVDPEDPDVALVTAIDLKPEE